MILTPINVQQLLFFYGMSGVICYMSNGDGTYVMVAPPYDVVMLNATQDDMDFLTGLDSNIVLKEMSAINFEQNVTLTPRR